MVSSLTPIEPLVLRMGLVARYAIGWFRFSRVLGVPRFRSIALFQLVLLSSLAARAAEIAGSTSPCLR